MKIYLFFVQLTKVWAMGLFSSYCGKETRKAYLVKENKQKQVFDSK